MKRALNCTQQMAAGHLDELASDLIEAGIFQNANKVKPGVWTRVVDTPR